MCIFFFYIFRPPTTELFDFSCPDEHRSQQTTQVIQTRGVPDQQKTKTKKQKNKSFEKTVR